MQCLSRLAREVRRRSTVGGVTRDSLWPMRRTVSLIAAAAVIGSAGCDGNGAGTSSATRKETSASIAPTASAHGRCTPQSDGFVALPCLHLPRSVAPPHAHATAFPLNGGHKGRVLVRWTLSDATANGFGIWRQTGGGWLRMYTERTPPPGGKDPYGMGFSFGDVTQDRLADVLVDGQMGSGACGPRELITVGRTSVSRLFRRFTCEVHSSIQDGLFVYRDTVGDCLVPAAHCYSGIRVDLRGYNSRRLVDHRVILRCFRPVQPGHRGCPQVRDRLAMG